MIDYQELKRLAEAASPGPWKYWGEVGHEIFGRPAGSAMTKIFMLCREAKEADGEYIAAANPAAVLSLISVIESAKLELHDQANILYQRRMKIADLQAEVEALRKDAERYRWLIHNAEEIYVCNQNLHLDPHYLGAEKVKKEADRVIDLAMAKESEQ